MNLHRNLLSALLLFFLFLVAARASPQPLWCTSGNLNAVSVTPGNLLTNVLWSSTIQVWEMNAWNMTSTFFVPVSVDHTATATGGRLLFANNQGFYNGSQRIQEVRFWSIDMKTSVLKEVTPPNSHGSSGMISNDGSTFLTLSGDFSTLSFWDANTGIRLLDTPVDHFELSKLQFSLSQRGDVMANYTYNSHGMFVMVFNVTAQKVLGTIPIELGLEPIDPIILSADGRVVVFSYFDSSLHSNFCICYWNVKTQTAPQVIVLDEYTELLALSPSGTFLAYGGWGLISVVNTATGDEVTFGNPLSGYDVVGHTFFSPDESEIIFGTDTVYVRTIATGVLKSTHLPNIDGAIALSPRGDFVAGVSDKQVKILEAKSGRVVHTFVGHAELLYDIDFSPAGDLLASASADNTVRVWNTTTGAIKHVFTCEGDMRAVAFSKTGNLLAAAGEDGVLRIWDSITWTSIRNITASTELLNVVTFLPDGQGIATSGEVASITLWDVNTGRLTANLTCPDCEGNNGAVTLSISADTGLMLSSQISSGDVILWDTYTGEQLAFLYSGDGSTVRAAISDDGRFAVVADDDLLFFDVATYDLLDRIPVRAQYLALSRDGKKVAVSQDFVSLWEVPV